MWTTTVHVFLLWNYVSPMSADREENVSNVVVKRDTTNDRSSRPGNDAEDKYNDRTESWGFDQMGNPILILPLGELSTEYGERILQTFVVPDSAMDGSQSMTSKCSKNASDGMVGDETTVRKTVSKGKHVRRHAQRGPYVGPSDSERSDDGVPVAANSSGASVPGPFVQNDGCPSDSKPTKCLKDDTHSTRHSFEPTITRPNTFQSPAPPQIITYKGSIVKATPPLFVPMSQQYGRPLTDWSLSLAEIDVTESIPQLSPILEEMSIQQLDDRPPRPTIDGLITASVTESKLRSISAEKDASTFSQNTPFVDTRTSSNFITSRPNLIEKQAAVVQPYTLVTDLLTPPKFTKTKPIESIPIAKESSTPLLSDYGQSQSSGDSPLSTRLITATELIPGRQPAQTDVLYTPAEAAALKPVIDGPWNDRLNTGPSGDDVLLERVPYISRTAVTQPFLLEENKAFSPWTFPVAHREPSSRYYYAPANGATVVSNRRPPIGTSYVDEKIAPRAFYSKPSPVIGKIGRYAFPKMPSSNTAVGTAHPAAKPSRLTVPSKYVPKVEQTPSTSLAYPEHGWILSASPCGHLSQPRQNRVCNYVRYDGQRHRRQTAFPTEPSDY